MPRKKPAPPKKLAAAQKLDTPAVAFAVVAPAPAATSFDVIGAPAIDAAEPPRVTAPDIGPAAGTAVLIEIDPSVSGGYVHNRFDVMIRGRAVSTAAIEEIRLQDGDRVISTASYGLPERAAPAVMPDGRPARQRAFHFNLPRPGEGRPERCAFQVVARIDDGSEFSKTFELDIDPAKVDSVSLVSGPARSVASGPVRPHAIMYIERATIDADGVLNVQGWAVSLGPVLAIQIYAGEERVAKARFGSERDDVAAVFPAYPHARTSGFNLVHQLDPADRDTETIRAQVVCPNGFGHEESIPVERLVRRAAPRPQPVLTPEHPDPLRPEPSPEQMPGGFSLINQRPSYHLRAEFRIEEEPLIGLVLPPPAAPEPPEPAHAARPEARDEPSGEIKMFCDAAVISGDGTVTVNGWAVCGAGIAQVRILVDDIEVGLASFGHDRPDVGAAFPGIPLARLSGFKFSEKVRDRFEGEFTVRVAVRNLRDEEKSEIVQAFARPSPRPEQAPTAARPPAAVPPEQTPEQAAEFKFELDSPALTNGAVAEVITGRLTIDGWLLTRSGIASFEVFLDDQRLGEAHYGLARQDVGTAFPDWPNSLRSGFAFHCPPRSLRDGERTVRLAIKSNNGPDMSREFKITVKKSEDQEDQAGIRRRVPRVETDMMAGFLAELGYRPSFRFVLRQDRSIDLERLRKTFDSLRPQMYDPWAMLVLAEDDDVAAAIQVVAEETAPWLADRFTVATPSQGGGWTAALAREEEGRNVLHALLLPGDEIGADALFELAVAAGRHPGAGLLYGDEIRVSPVSSDKEPFFKPDLSPDLLCSTNYFGRLWVVAGEVLAATGATPASLLAGGEYDLALRCWERAGTVYHVPKLLCQRGIAGLDEPEAEKAALEAMLDRRDIDAEVLPTPVPGTWRLRRTVLTRGMVSIIIPTCAANGYIETCVKSLREKTTYKNYEIIVIDNIPVTDMSWKVWVARNADKVVDIPAAFNWSVFNNRAAEAASGEFLLFLNDDITITQPDWLEAMLEHGQRPEVGITGPQLLYPDGKVQHAGMFLGNNGIGRHAFRFAAHDDPCYFGLALTQRNVMAVTGACMLVRKSTFDQLGGFEDAHEIVNNDLDFCLRAHQAGLLTVFTPYATMIHHELASRARMKDVFDLTHFNAAWKTTFAAGDPYFNPRLSRHADDYRPDDEPVQWVVSGAPMFRVEEIQRILVVKLDHIGDFVTALPPIRRLRKIFPQARITVLAGPASRAFVSLEPAIDEFIPFAFFHARSQLGEREVGKEEFDELAAQLRPYRFDLAIDLRKHPSTRDVLKYTGARFLAGFDYLGQYPNLDIALDWDGDRTLQRKRSHIAVDLMSLVNAVGYATEADRVIMKPGPAPMPLAEMPEPVRALFAKPVVAIHPGAGNITKQWPEEHFSALIDLLIERNGVNILLVGGPDEVEVADRLLENVLRTDAIASMAGQTSLADLPRLLKNCALYIGNDSGPKHIAAAVGIPTIGIHSGVVDPVEWGPIGPNAVALRRNMTCSPCYLAKAEDCPRSLACLRLFEPSLVYETADMMLKRPAAAPLLVAERPSPPEEQAPVRARKAQPQTAESAL
jgi:ADP-heptose:LPS heptosyltransferase/GT2 family glycosyltransferase